MLQGLFQKMSQRGAKQNIEKVVVFLFFLSGGGGGGGGGLGFEISKGGQNIFKEVVCVYVCVCIVCACNLMC